MASTSGHEEVDLPEPHRTLAGARRRRRIDRAARRQRLWATSRSRASCASSATRVAASTGSPRPEASPDTPAPTRRGSATLRQFLRAQGVAHAHRPDAVGGWLNRAVQGAAAGATDPAAASAITVRLLAITTHASQAQGEATSRLVVLARRALAETDHADAPPARDPLARCTTLLRNSYAKAITPSPAGTC